MEFQQAIKVETFVFILCFVFMVLFKEDLDCLLIFLDELPLQSPVAVASNSLIYKQCFNKYPVHVSLPVGYISGDGIFGSNDVYI